MEEELQALTQNNTWRLVLCPLNNNVVGSKRMFRLKYKDDGSIYSYKARLVVKGFIQVLGQDYAETFSLVIHPTTIQLILALSYSNNWTLKQLDAKNVFLHENLKELVFREQPPDFSNHNKPHHVCLL